MFHYKSLDSYSTFEKEEKENFLIFSFPFSTKNSLEDHGVSVEHYLFL